jgi:hypothetical protein
MLADMREQRDKWKTGCGRRARGRGSAPYRGETAMVQTIRHQMTRHDDARSLLRAIYGTEVDLVPDTQAGTLTVRLHPLANQSSDDALRHLCAELNATQTLFPRTNLRLIYELVSDQSP